VDKAPDEVFAAINNVRGWWSEDIEGRTDKLGAEFTYRYRDLHHCKMQIVELAPNERVVWLVLDNGFSFTKDKTEWKGTKIIFEISRKGDKTEVCFTHLGLVPEYECYDVCSDGWSTYINGSLRALIATGRGHPNVREAVTDSERALTRRADPDVSSQFVQGSEP
jgi:Activator of Hsp90 ATPase homolog 1-like protein